MTRPTPTILETIAGLRDLEEVTGFTARLREDGRLTEEATQALARRKAEIQMEMRK